MRSIGHEMILASAGSGKTYALTNRFVRLLAGGAKPERIVALTFTRKAAGEFFDEILNKLAGAARDAEAARKLAAEIGRPEFGTADFLKLLRAMADTMHRLRLGTFDGFFARIARSFPLELGLTGEFEILQQHAAHVERARVLRRMFERSGELGSAQREFIEAFKRATFGAEEKRLGTRLDAFLDEHQEIFLAAPAAELWGNPERIWPDGADWRGASAQREGAARGLQAALRNMEMSDKQRARWEAFFTGLAAWTPGAPMGDGLDYLLANAVKAWPELREITVERKKLALPDEARVALRALVHAIVESEMARRIEMTRGIRAVLAAYDRFYNDAVRRAGKLTFGDVQRLLQPGMGGAPILSLGGMVADEEGDTERRLAIDYRLDGEIDHWLLDEFQDTSFGQWAVLKNLIDEAVQDPEGGRSFFYVGDVKQAIFAWREGDPRLFREIFDYYNALQPGMIAERHLVESWRSGPPIIAAVNRVFGDAAVLSELFPGAASAAWNREWRAHVSAKPQLGGHVALLQVPASGSGQAEDERARFAVAVRILHEIAPLERGMSCALLVQDNATAGRLADYLRREGGLPATAESDLHVCTDNPLGAALLALVKAAAHPGDTLAQEHLRMTPLHELLVAEGGGTPEALTRAVLGQIHAEGFERTMQAWTRRLEPKLAEDDAFSRERARQFVAAAGLFDATGGRDVAGFIAFMERHTVRDVDSAASLRVMTIHKSKGLGFDVVLLPDLEGIRLDCRRNGLAVQKGPDRSVAWVLDLPEKLFHGQDPVLSAHVGSAEADACYESLSLLYVAMTRAKRAMYAITKPPGASTSRNYPKLLAETLGEETKPVRVGRIEVAGSFDEGDPDWHVTVAVAPAPVVTGDGEVEQVRVTAPARRLPGRRASAGKRAEVAGAQLFSASATRATDFGNALHALLAQVEWCDEGVLSRLRLEGRKRGCEQEIVEAAIACVTAPGLAAVWRRRERAGVWRERGFEVVLDGVWITGVFDRVIVERDEAGQPVAAAVVDFKTDWVGRGDDLTTLVSRHAAQLAIYRRVAARLTGLPETAVTADVLFTGGGGGGRLARVGTPF